MKFVHLALAILAGLLLALWSPAIGRAQDYPNRNITMLVPFAPGGGTDAIARLLGQKLGERLGKTVVVENKPGAGTVIAASALAKSPPDGHTLMMGTSSTMAINVTLYKKLPYDPRTELTPVALICTVPFVLVVNPSLGVETVADLIKLAKSKPRQLSYASGGPGAAHHLFAELLSSMTGIEMTHIAYRGSAPGLTDVVAGHIPLMFADLAPAMGLIKDGKLKALGVTTITRAAAAPNIPPLNEMGVPGFDAAAWQMVLAPAGTPKPIIDRLNAELRDIVKIPEVRQQLVNLGLDPIPTPAHEELLRFVQAETVLWGEIVKKTGATVE